MSETHEDILIISHYGNIIQNYMKLSTHFNSYRFLMENMQCWQRCGEIKILKNAGGNAKSIYKKRKCIPIPNKGNAKECSNYCTIALISHASKIMLKILQARLQSM